jgi:hypothetical protein
MIIFILVNKNLRKTINILDVAVQSSKVKKIYILLTHQTEIKNHRLSELKKKYIDKILFFKHNQIGIKGAWIQAMNIAIKENSDYIIFENDIVPTNFFLEYANKCFLFYKNEKKLFCFTGFSPKKNSKISNKLSIDTNLSYRSSSWSFASNVRVTNDFLLFIKQTSDNKIRKILWENRAKIGKDIYFQCLADQKNNLNLIGNIWSAFMIVNKGLCLYPSEHLVSYYGNDSYAENCNRDGQNIISNFDVKNFKDIKINLKSTKEFSDEQNKKIISHWYPNILKRVLNKIKKKMKYLMNSFNV